VILYLSNGTHRCLEEANRALCREDGLVSLGCRARNTVVELELEVLFNVLLGNIALEFAGGYDAGVDDLNSRAASTVATSKLGV